MSRKKAICSQCKNTPENNFEIGLALLKKDYKKAIELNDDESVKEYIFKHPTDYVGALRKIPV